MNTIIKLPSASPLEIIKQDFALSNIEISYARPSTKGRTIFGDLVPYNQLWRTGANGATIIKLGEDVTLNGNNIPAGRYMLLTIPNKSEWEIILNKDIDCKNPGFYNHELDVIRFKVKSKTLVDKVETFTIEINEVVGAGANICIKWEHTAVNLTVMADIDSTIMESIKANMSMPEGKKYYYYAATYYYETNRDSQQALIWVNEDLKQNPHGFWMNTLKASLLLRLKDYNGAIEVAQAATSGAIQYGYTPNHYDNDRIIKEAQEGIKNK